MRPSAWQASKTENGPAAWYRSRKCRLSRSLAGRLWLSVFVVWAIVVAPADRGLAQDARELRHRLDSRLDFAVSHGRDADHHPGHRRRRQGRVLLELDLGLGL